MRKFTAVCSSSLLGLVSLGFLGCATQDLPPDRPVEQKVFTFVLKSDPPGMRIRKQLPYGKFKEIGTTPHTFRVPFKRLPTPGVLGHMGMSSWQPALSGDSSWSLLELGETYRLDLRDIRIGSDGYDEEEYQFRWHIPKDLAERNEEGKVIGEVGKKREETVVMRIPTKPEYLHRIEVVSLPTGASLYELSPNGEPGKEIAKTPLEFIVGFGRVRNEKGEIEEWKSWFKDDRGMLSFASEGLVLMNVAARLEGHQVEKISGVPIMKVQPGLPEKLQHQLRMTNPTEPQHEFLLNVDSLPTEGDVFVLREDGTLGRKIGETPFHITLGLGEKLKLNSTGLYTHDDWLVWGPGSIIQWKRREDGSTSFMLSCAIFREGFATEKVLQEIFRLRPGQTPPGQKTFTIPLLHPQQAAARESIQSRPAPTPTPTPTPEPVPTRKPYVWKDPADTPAATPEPEKKRR